MQRTTAGLRPDTATRLAQLERQRPEWRVWLRLLGEAERALDDSGWLTPLDEAELGDRLAGSDDTPLLNGRGLKVNAGVAQRLVRTLASIAAAEHLIDADALGRYRPSAADAVALIVAAVRQDPTELAALAGAAGVEPGPFMSVAHLAAFPLLQSCGRLLADHVPRHWPHGHCPICAAWPILAERRGLDRSRRLRCGRCGAEWEVQWLYCVYCGERKHQQLGFLVPEDGGETLKVETCASCGGYLKSIATLQGIPPFELILRDLETVELDLVAVERGYGRPEESRFRLEVRLA
ncbi:MAG TPA: formate dehydrogenase accessory protein FdhE [Gemmatimonadales bacterium]|nr:formate dehydrogenase accessory protein FdhE [Gemmatimonadales bacterium]